MAAADKVCVGAIAGAHGVRGAVRIKPFTAEPQSVAGYGPLSDESGTRNFDLTVTGQSRGQLIATIAGVSDRGAADALRGVRLYVPRTALPPAGDDEFYHADLIGLRVEDTAGARLGRVQAVHDFGAGDVLDVTLQDGRGVMVPFTEEAVPVVDVKGGRVVIDPPPGLLEDEGPPPGQPGHDAAS